MRNVTSAQKNLVLFTSMRPARRLVFDIDCKRLLNEFESWGTLLSAPIYYTTIIEDQEFS